MKGCKKREGSNHQKESNKGGSDKAGFSLIMGDSLVAVDMTAYRRNATAVTPLWVVLLFLEILVGGGAVGLYMQYSSIPFYYVIAFQGGNALLIGVVSYFVVCRRLSMLTQFMEQDPRVIVGDALCIKKLRTLPWYGVYEIDAIQLAITETYNRYAIDMKREGRGGGVSQADDLEQISWHSAEECGEEEPFREPSDPPRRWSLKKLLTPRSKRASPARRFMTPASPSEETRLLDCHSAEQTVAVENRSSGLEQCAPIQRQESAEESTTKFCDPLGDNCRGWDEVMHGVKDSGGSMLLQLLSQVKVGQSLSAVTLPVHILEPRSLLEKLSDMLVHHDLLLPLCTPRDPSANAPDKVVELFRWFISAYRMRPQGAKKPFNPIIGEVFLCSYPPCCPGDDEVVYLAEQISHHPPVTAIHVESERFEVHAIYHPHSKLVSLNCAAGIGIGSAIIRVKSTQETFRFTFPSAYVSGFIAGNMRMELGGNVTLTDETTKQTVKVEFLRKGWLSGTYDQVSAVVHDAKGKPTDQKFGGTWHDEVSELTGNSKVPFWSTASRRPLRPTALDLEHHPKQSRAIWQHLTTAIRNEDAAAAQPAKHAVETAQREERKLWLEQGTWYKPVYFEFKGGKSIKDAKDDLFVPENWRFIGQHVFDQHFALRSVGGLPS